MPTRLPPDFTPTEQTLNNLRKHGAIPEFVDHELEMFIAYFTNKGIQWDETPKEERTKKLRQSAFKEDWQMCVQRWMRESWRGKPGRDWEYNRHKRQDSGGLFDWGDCMKAQEKACETIKNSQRTVYRIPERPEIEIDPSKTTEDYLNELAKII